MTTLPLHVPDTVASGFLVSADDPPPSDVSTVLTGGGLADLARELLDRSAMTVRAHSPTAEWLARSGGSSGHLRRLRNARHHMLIRVQGPPDDAPRHAQAARQTARLLAAATGGLVVDVDSRQVVGISDAEPARFVLGEGWIGVFVTEERGLVRADTWGMHRFGLPEVAVRGAPYGHLLTAANLLRVLAFRLFSERREKAIPDTLFVDGSDLLRFWGARPLPAGRFTVALARGDTTCPDCHRALEVASATAPTTGGTTSPDEPSPSCCRRGPSRDDRKIRCPPPTRSAPLRQLGFRQPEIPNPFLCSSTEERRTVNADIRVRIRWGAARR